MPLSGIKVVEMTQNVFGPVVGSVLAEWGADVIKIERLEGGDIARGLFSYGYIEELDKNPFLELCNHNKRGICIDLKQQEGRKLGHDLISKADVFICNMLPSTLKKLNMDYKTLSSINPRLIYAQATGYGLKGGEADTPAFDDTAFWARGGIMMTLGEPDVAPPGIRGAQGDMPAASTLVSGILLALLHRSQTGLGQLVDTSLLGSAVWVNAADIQSAIIARQDIPRMRRKAKMNPLINHYETKDHRWVQLCMPQTDPYWHGLCKSIDRDDLEHDSRFDTHEKRIRNHEILIQIFDEAIGSRTVGELAARFDKQGLIWGLASTLPEVIKDPQVLANEYLRDAAYPDGIMKTVVYPVKLSNIPKRDIKPAPELGQHTEEVLLELGYSWDEISMLKEHKVIP